MTDVEHGAGGLLARVMVNRLWQHHIGRGLVATPSDFGVRGEMPTHPELLDWLAGEFIASGWRLKAMHKLIMSSSTYMLDGAASESRLKADRENKLIWRRPGKRLEAEVIRDSLLAVSGALDDKMYGPGTLDEGSKRRSIYFTVKRSKLIPMMVVFDAPEALVGVADRPATTIAPQALMMMNNPHIRSWAAAFATKLAATSSAETAIKTGYQIALGRQPTSEELADCMDFVKAQQSYYSKRTNARGLALTDFCQTLMCSNEFVFIE
jgi:hypothetical protein